VKNIAQINGTCLAQNSQPHYHVSLVIFFKIIMIMRFVKAVHTDCSIVPYYHRAQCLSGMSTEAIQLV